MTANQAGLAVATYTTTVTLQATGIGGVAPVQVPVTLLVVEQVQQAYLPMVLR